MLRTTSDELALESPVVRRDGSHAHPSFARARAPTRARRDRDATPPDAAIAFLGSSGLSPSLLAHASAEARRIGVSADAALLAGRGIDEEAFYRALARHVGSAFVTRDACLAPSLDVAAAAAAGIAPLARWPGGPRWLLAPRGAQIQGLVSHIEAREVVLTTPRHFERFLRDADPARIAADAGSTLDVAAPGLSARHRIAPKLWPIVAGVAAFASLVAWVDFGFALAVFNAVVWCCFAAACVQRLCACAASFDGASPAPSLSDRALPTYTIVVALYREANMADDIVAAIQRIDYPRAKLDVKFVVEADDAETCAALSRVIRGVGYDIIVAPDGQPRTKPRALNIALPFARGELLAIFDAEDRPDPRQLRRAAAEFARAPLNVACLQARLAIDNADEGWLQALYALDYAALFCVLNPGFAYHDLPMFLGGSSNHFRSAQLRAVGGWDAWNVTEDADLGVRLARQGFFVRTFASDTNEEAPVTAAGFFGQRVRWKKGWLQTFCVHAREPRRLLRDLGPLKSGALLCTFAAGILGPLLWPVFVGYLAWNMLAGDLLEPDGALAIIRSTLLVGLAAFGLLTMFGPLALGAVRQGLKRKLLYLPLLPVWHVALCVAAWTALFELSRNPHRWAKTEHGLARRRTNPVS